MKEHTISDEHIKYAEEYWERQYFRSMTGLTTTTPKEILARWEQDRHERSVKLSTVDNPIPCLACGIFLKNQAQYKKHLRKKEHLRNIVKLQENLENWLAVYASKRSDGEVHCPICDVWVDA